MAQRFEANHSAGVHLISVAPRYLNAGQALMAAAKAQRFVANRSAGSVSAEMGVSKARVVYAMAVAEAREVSGSGNFPHGSNRQAAMAVAKARLFLGNQRWRRRRLEG